MYRRILGLLLIIIIAFLIGYFSRDIDVLETFISDHLSEPTTSAFETTFEPTIEPETLIDSTYDFINFTGEHVLDIEPLLQMPDFPTGCESVSLTMALNYITGETINTSILIDDYLSLSESGDFVSAFLGDPRSTDGGGCFPPAIINAANHFLADNHITLYALDATGINSEQIKHYIDNGFPIIMWTTMYMQKPEFHNQYREFNGTTYQWYTSEHCVLIKGYDPDRNVFIVNDPLIGEVEQDIDEFMEISDLIGNLAVIIL